MAIGGLILQGISTAVGISENEKRNRRLRVLGAQQADAHRAAGDIASRNYLEDAETMRRRALQTREQAQVYEDQGLIARGQQSLAFTRGGVRLSGTALDRLSETTERIARGRGRIDAVAGEQDRAAQRLVQAASDARTIAGYRAESAQLAAEAGQQSSLAIGLQGLAGAAPQVANIAANWQSWFPEQTPAPRMGGSGSFANPNYNTMSERSLLQWG